MLAMYVDFEFENDGRELVAKVAAESVPMFEGMAGLRSKTFTIDASGRHATNVYFWDDEEVGRSFFSDEIIELATGLYGVPPTIRYADVLQVVANDAAVVTD